MTYCNIMEEYYRHKWVKLAYLCQMKRAALNISYQKRALEGEWLRRLVYMVLSYYATVFLFGILGMGAGPSELGKSPCEIGKLRKVEMCLKP